MITVADHHDDDDGGEDEELPDYDGEADFSHALNVKVASSDLVVYVSGSDDRQHEWITSLVWLLILKSGDAKHAMKRFRVNVESILTYHRELWPGVEWDRMKPSHVKGLPAPKQKQSFPEATIPTSMMIASIAFAIGSPKRNPESRIVSSAAFFALVAKTLASVGPCIFWLRDIGVENPLANQEGWIEISYEGPLKPLDLSLVWNGEAGERIRTVWSADFEDETKPWITTQVCRTDLQSFLCFSLGPTHDEDVKAWVLPNAYSVLTQFAFILEEHVESMGREDDRIISTRSRGHSSIKTMEKRLIAERVWSGKARILEHIYVMKSKKQIAFFLE